MSDSTTPAAPARPYTEDEVGEALCRHVDRIIETWARMPDSALIVHADGPFDPQRLRLERVVAAVLGLLDGRTGTDQDPILPGFIVAPAPHYDDRAAHAARSENWFPENHDMAIACDLGGGLKEAFEAYLTARNARAAAVNDGEDE